MAFISFEWFLLYHTFKQCALFFFNGATLPSLSNDGRFSLSLPNPFYFCRRSRELFFPSRMEYHHARNGGEGMEKRLVKKEEIEKQLQEIVALIEQVDAKMEQVIADVIEEQYAQNKEQLGHLEGRIAGVERRLDGGKGGTELRLSSKLYLV
ncbi:hypothetical protein [Geobacillus thermodenitrificans]|jgi:hypothetical protein|uniref:hypothetical protein n=1 Tax=Geobacillus thermodenitrificans TaxID=33940 RepID=UPI0004168B16|nr:hypothetical protein [Geobacillus thermodenitrificans]MED3717210.1 hypothetical protein [Geobacillus thermodenitrificans]